MEGEINNLIMVWALVYVSVCYCYGVARIIPKGRTRLITFLPVVSLFLFLPLNYLHSIHLGGGTCVFISWLGNFKLLMFAFDVGPLADQSLPLPHFVALACLPIKYQKNPPPQPPSNLKVGPNKDIPYPEISRSGIDSPLVYAFKGLALALWVRGYDYSNYLYPKVVRFQIIIHLCGTVEFLFAIFATLAQVLLRTKVEPQFNDPHLSTSLHNFWGSRWNLMVSDTLRSSIYRPIRNHFRPILGHEWSLFLALMGSFLVSGLMHDLVLYQTGRMRPKWRCTLFFVIHGLCLIVEIVTKNKLSGKFRLPSVISGLVTLAFVAVTFSRLILTELLQIRVVQRLFEEYAAVGTFMREIIH
ncbi:acyl-CoA--sterol O-acyltransferase 1-like [Cornus florida]|uniref:acyl-CoA--sterol O-acyltransferase 1-like n=1 Tax=Cornus florida TaxID=4283 RepID=UPI00289DF973|nr:acyl-CoA--sterol O-acyltransferase 1-like [Cornus florida]